MDYGHTPYGYNVNPYTPAGHCRSCSAHRNTADLLGGEFCDERCRDDYDRTRSDRSGGGSSSRSRTSRPGGLHGF